MSKLRTAAEYRQLAADSSKAAAESWERSDTDGALSQWAADQMAARYSFLASVAEDGGKLNVVVLFLDGELASTDQRNGQYGFYWILNDAAAAKYGKRFYSPSKARNATERDRARGFTYGQIRVDAFENPKTGHATEDYEAIARGEFEVIATDGANDEIDAAAS